MLVTLAFLAALFEPRSSPPAPAAEPAARPLVSAPLVLAGGEPVARVTVATSADGRIALDLAVRWSEALDLERSTVAVRVDGVPLATARLAAVRADGGRLRGATASVPAGFHTVEVLAHLYVDDDRCAAPDPTEAWLLVDPDSTVRVPDADAAPPLAAVIEDLARELDQPLEIALGDGELASPDAALAWLDAATVVRGWRRLPVRLDGARAAPLRVRWDGAAPTVAGAVARVDVAAGRIEISAHTVDGARAALASLADPRFVNACVEPTCWVGAAPVPVATRERRPSSTATLASLGFDRGFTASGDGDHTLRFTWQRPATLRPRRWPELHLLVTVPSGGLLDRAASGVRVAVNDRPVRSFDLRADADGALHLVAPIPEALFADAAWTFEITVALRATRDRPCARDELALWAVVEPDSFLKVPADVERWEGLAELVLASAGRRPPLLDAGALTWAQVEAIAAAVEPFAAASPGQPWRWAATCAAPVCIAPTTDRRSPGQRAALAAAAGIPLAAADPLVLRREPGPGGLRLVIGAPVDVATPPVPDYAALLGATAIADAERWYPADLPDGPTEVAAAAVTSTRAGWPQPSVSQEARRRLTRDVGLGVLGLVIAALGWRWVRRARTRA